MTVLVTGGCGYIGAHVVHALHQAGEKVVVTLPGAVLPGDFKIEPRKTYGHISNGMCASERELGLGDNHNGIILLRQ